MTMGRSDFPKSLKKPPTKKKGGKKKGGKKK